MKNMFTAAEQRISGTPVRIQQEFIATLGNLSLEHQQFTQCRALVDVYRRAEKAYRQDFKTYTANLGALHGNNDKLQIYVDEATRARTKDVCYLLEAQASDTDYRLMFELDKKALINKYQQQRESPDLGKTQATDLDRRIEQLRHAHPCQVVGSDRGVSFHGECGFEGDKEF